MTSPLRLDQIVECADQLPTRTEQGGTEDRRPILRGGKNHDLARVDTMGESVDSPTASAVSGVVSNRPDSWLLDGYAQLFEATARLCGLRPLDEGK